MLKRFSRWLFIHTHSKEFLVLHKFVATEMHLAKRLDKKMQWRIQHEGIAQGIGLCLEHIGLTTKESEK